MVRWLRWHCPPDTGFEIRALAVWGRARYLSVTEAPHNTDFPTWMGKKHFCFFETAETGNRTPNSGVKGSGANHYPRAPAHIGPSLAKNNYIPKNIKVEDFLTSTRNCTFLFYKTDDSSILNIINELLNKTSTEFYDLSMKLIKLIKSEIIPTLTGIFKQSLHTGIFPDKLKIAKVIPIYKKGSLNDISNYRPISLLPSLSKIFDKLIFIQLSTYLNEHKLLHDSQYGFRKGHSTELASIELIDRITQDLDRGKMPISIFLDLSKAFYTLDHDILLQQLNHYGIRS